MHYTIKYRCSESLSNALYIYTITSGTKSDIVRCLEDVIEEHDDTTPSVEVVVLHGPAIVHMLKPAVARTLREYAQDMFLPYVEHKLDKTQRVDVMWDDYRPDSLKAQTRDMRGKGIRRRVEPNRPNAVPKNWAEFLRNNENKTELFAFLSREIVTLSTDKQVICTLDRDVICRQPMHNEGLSPCSHEEADSRIMVHVAHAANTYTHILIRTVDSDVVVLAVYAFAQLTSSLNELWVAFGTGMHYRMIPAHKICAAIGLDKCLALRMFHAFTGCDTVSCFSGRGYRTAWDTWNMYPEIPGQFASLMKKPQLGDVDAAMDTIERFVVLLYDKTNTGSEVNMVRFELFARKSRDINNIPPTKGALLQHARRAAYQAGHCWIQAIEPQIELPRPAGWGWVGTDGGK